MSGLLLMLGVSRHAVVLLLFKAMLDRSPQYQLIQEVTAKFTPVENRLVFGSLVYPSRGCSYLPEVNIVRHLHHFIRQVLDQLPRRTGITPQLKRMFVIENNDEAGRHAHFIFETPRGMTSEDFMEVCRESWTSIALRERRQVAELRELNKGTTIHPTEQRTILIKNKRLSRPGFPTTREIQRTSKRRLADLEPVYDLLGAVCYCLKLEGVDSEYESGAVVLDATTTEWWIKGHSPTMCLW